MCATGFAARIHFLDAVVSNGTGGGVRAAVADARFRTHTDSNKPVILTSVSHHGPNMIMASVIYTFLEQEVILPGIFATVLKGNPRGSAQRLGGKGRSATRRRPGKHAWLPRDRAP